MAYSEKLLDYFQNPRCVGEIPDAHAIAEVSNPVCGDVMKLWVKVDDGRIQDAKFKAQGCSAIGIELNPQFVEMARRRILGDAPLCDGKMASGAFA